MSEENVKTVAAIFDRAAQGDFSHWLDDVTDDFVFVSSPDVPDGGTYRGEAARNRVTAWVESFVGHTIDAREFIDAEDQVFFEILQEGRPRGSKVPVEGRWWVVTTFRGGAIARVEVFDEAAEALRAAGLSE
ncbi:MAG TPA: nuclear transport factor 2 family protein [Solirubrobacterales bacterium]|jgi:ketosteroid isomerase-like protein|nr:nuclear transport factor 2 family protein [Solirubrobacterales bacterium]